MYCRLIIKKKHEQKQKLLNVLLSLKYKINLMGDYDYDRILTTLSIKMRDNEIQPGYESFYFMVLIKLRKL